MAYYTIQQLVDFNLGACLDTYLMNIDSAIPCPNCNGPVLSMACNNFATEHVYC
jgi:hypothetical protein